MRTSERELLGLASAAAVGKGYPHGISDDLARAAVWLVQRDADGLGALIHSVPRDDTATRGPVSTAADLPAVIADVHVGSDGPGLLDLLLADRLRRRADRSVVTESMTLRLSGLDSPMLLVGLCGVAATATGTAVHLRFAGATPVTPEAFMAATAEDARRSAVGEAVEIFYPADDDPVDAIVPPTRLVVSDERWAEAEALAARTYVPASEQSRHSGAGAGLTDND